MITVTEIRNDDSPAIVLAYVKDEHGTIVYGMEGARKRTPFYSGSMSHEDAALHMADRLSNGFRVI